MDETLTIKKGTKQHPEHRGGAIKKGDLIPGSRCQCGICSSGTCEICGHLKAIHIKGCMYLFCKCEHDEI